MNPDLLHHYNVELAYLREMGAEFAAEYPKIASRLRMGGIEVADPHVERLLEGFAFLAARIQVKLDAGFPRFTQRLLDIVHPQYLAPIPSMLVVRLEVMVGEAALLGGVTVPRHAGLHGTMRTEGGMVCRYRSAHDVTLWPIELAAARYFEHTANLDLASVSEWRSYAGGIGLTLRTTGDADFSAIGCNDLRLYCGGAEETAYRLHELICGHALGIVLRSADGRTELLDADAIEPVGFEDDQALLPVSLRGFQGFRILQEYFAFPWRFLFFDIAGIGNALRRLGGSEVEVTILLRSGDDGLQRTVNTTHFALHCVPVINLFEHRCDRIHVNASTTEFHVVPDRTHPLDLEIVEVLEVVGYGTSMEAERRFRPLYSAFHAEGARPDAWFTIHREPRFLSANQRRDGPRTAYIGSEVSLSIVDQQEAPYGIDLQQLGVRALCSNRDLPVLMGAKDVHGAGLLLDQTAPVSAVRVLKSPSRPLPPKREGNLAWQLINQLTLNHIGVMEQPRERGGEVPGHAVKHSAAALRDVLRLYLPDADAALQRQVEGVWSLRSSPVVRKLAMPGPIAFGRGIQIDVEVDDLAFQGGSAYIFGSVLARFFSRLASINSFTQTRVYSMRRGDIYIGEPLCGARPML